MKVLMVSDVYFPRVNGVSTSIETFRARLAARGVTVDLLAPAYGSEEVIPGLLRVPAWAVPLDPEDRAMRPLPLWRQIRALDGVGYDLVHIQTPFLAHYAGISAARRWRVPVLATYHTFFEEYLYHYLPFLPAASLRGLARRFSRRQGNSVDALVVPSTAMRDRLAEYGVTRPLHVLPTGIPLARFSKGDGEAFRARHGIAPDRPVALFVGRVAHEKNIAFLLEVWGQVCRSVPDALLLIAGEGPAKVGLQKAARENGLEGKVHFLGYMDRERELPDCYAAASAFVFASKTETQGLVLLEAMAMGVPVVALSAMGTADILRGRGCRVPPEDSGVFATTVVEVLRDAELRGRLAVEAKAEALAWSDDAMARRMAELYDALGQGMTQIDLARVPL